MKVYICSVNPLRTFCHADHKAVMRVRRLREQIYLVFDRPLWAQQSTRSAAKRGVLVWTLDFEVYAAEAL